MDPNTISGVVDVVLQDNGDVLLTLADGTQLRVNEQNVEIADDGTIFLTGAAAEAVMIASAEVSTVEVGGNMIALGAGAGGLLLAAAAAGGGSGDDDPAPQPVELGFAIDGYLSGATVYGDANGNLILDVGEIQSVTGPDGSFNTALFPDDVPLVTIGGIDISTGEEFTGTLRAPAGSTNITPLTTLVQTLVEDTADSDAPLSVAQATANVASSLSLTGEAAELLTADPAALAENGDASQLQAAAKVAAVINLVTAAAPDDPSAVDTVLSALTTDLTDGGDDPFTSSDAIDAALATAGEAIQVNTTDLANAIVDISTAIDGVSGETADALAELEQIQTAVQGDLTDAVSGSVGDTSDTSPLATTVVTDTIDETVGLRPVITSFTDATAPLAEGSVITISGTGRIGSTVVVEIGAATQADAVGTDGIWSVTFDNATYLPDSTNEGTVPVVATAIDAGVTSGAAVGAPSYAIDNDPPAAPVIAAVTGDNVVTPADVTNDTYTVSGTAEEGSTVSVSVDGQVGEATMNGTSWSYAVPVAPGTEAAVDSIFAFATDSVGNQSPNSPTVQVSIDLVAPAAPTIDPVSDDNLVGIVDAPNATYTLTGTADEGSNVFVSVNGFVAQATVTGTTWSLDIAATPGTEFEQDTIFAYAEDAAGNQSPNSATVVVTADLTNPPQPNFDALNETIDATGITTVVISGSGEPNTTVVLESTLFDAPIEVAVGTDSNWSTGELDLTGAPDAVYQITATSVDEAGNTSPTATAERVVDVSAPAAPTIDPVSDDNLVGIVDAPNATYTLTGTADEGSNVFVSVNGLVAQATVTGTTWSLDIAATPGTEFEQDTIFAYAEDAAGNQSPNSATVVVTADLTNPPQPNFDALNETIDATGITTVVISGSGEPNTTVVLESTLFDAPIEVAVGTDSNWSTGELDLTGAPDAVYQITATSVDEAGNTSPTATAERVVDVVPDGTPVIRIFDIPEGFEYSAGTLVVYDGEELATITSDDGENESLRGTITDVPVGTEITLTVQNAAGADLIGPYTATTALDQNNEVGFVLAIPDTDVLGLDGMMQAATVTISGGGAEFILQTIVNSDLNVDGSGVFLAGSAVIEPFADIAEFGGLNAQRTILEGQEMDNGETVVVAEIADDDDPNSSLYTAILVYDGQSSQPARSFAFDGGANADVTPRTTKIDLRPDGIVLTQMNIVDDGNGGLAQGNPLFTVYNIPSASVTAAIPAPGSTETNIDTTAAGVSESNITLADFGGGPLVGEFFDLHFLPEAPGNPVFIAVREPLADGAVSTATTAVFGTIDLSNGEVTTRQIGVTEVAPSGSYERADVLSLIETDADGNYVSLTLRAPDQGDGLTREQVFDFATEKFSGSTLGGNDTQDLIVATEFREVIDGGDQTLGSNDNDMIVVGNQTDVTGNFQVSLVGEVATVSISTAALLVFFDEVTDDGSQPILVNMDVFTAGSAVFDTASVTGGANTATPDTSALSSFAPGIETSRVTVDIDLQAIRLLGASAPENTVLFDASVTGTDGTQFYGFGASAGSDTETFFDGFNVVGGVAEGSRKTVILADSQGLGGADVVSGFDVDNADAADQDLLIIQSEFGNFQGTVIESVGASPQALGGDTGIVIFEGETEDDDPAVITRAEDAGLGLADGQEIIAITADADNTSLWKLTYDQANDTYTTDSFGKLTGVTVDDLASFTNDNFTNIMLDLPAQLPIV